MTDNIENTIQLITSAIDRLINKQLNVIIHNSRFQQLEASWRGVALLTEQAAKDKQTQVRLLNLSLSELSKDILGAMDFDQTELFKKVYSDEFDQPGGEPYGLLVGDYYFNHKPTKACRDSIRTLSEVSKISATAFTPFITGISPDILGVNHFHEITAPFKLDDLMRQEHYQRWRQLRNEQNCRFVGLTMPKMLIRKPYQRYDSQYRHLFFEEKTNKHYDYLWTNASYAYASAAINSFQQTGWFMSMRGIDKAKQQGAFIKNTARDSFAHSLTKHQSKINTEYCFTDKQEQILAEHGFLVLHDNPLLETSIFYTSQSLHKAPKASKSSAFNELYIASQIHYLLCASRFAHYIKVIIRDKIGSFINANECQHFITTWLNSYCAASQDMSSSAKAKYPLQQANVKIHENIENPGKFNCEVNLKPHYQFDDIQTQLKLVTQVKIS